ncbi:MAG: response regulator [Dehalococcoidales bacterium]|nr:response regulator [Dehalococcoidales bacterium]
MKNPDASAGRVLVVEDEPSISQICLRTLSGEGFEVDIAANGAEAQERLKAKDYDICLVDIITPVMDGKRLFRWITEKHPEMATRVIFTTGDSINPDTRIFLEQAGRPLLPKPFTLDELRNVVRETLSQAGKWTEKKG